MIGILPHAPMVVPCDLQIFPRPDLEAFRYGH